MSPYFCWPPGVNNLFSPAKWEQERLSYCDKMNNVRFHSNGESVAAMVCACDVIQAKFVVGDMVPSSTVQPQESALVRHDKMHGARAQRGLTIGCASGTGNTLIFLWVSVFMPIAVA